MKLNKTRDYDKFQFINGNRNLNLTHLKHLENAILSENLLAANPIIVTKNWEIIDGQHRLTVAKNNNLDIYYLEVEGQSSLQQIQMLNANQKNWSMEDYINSNIALGNEDYKILKDFMEMYNFPVSIAINLIGGVNAKMDANKKDNMKNFKDGNFKVKSLKKGIQMAEDLMLLKPKTKDNAWKDRELIRALQVAFKKVPSKQLIKRILSSSQYITRQFGMKEYLRTLEDVYNFRLTEKNKIRFY
jgi:hypothetical protein